MEPHWDNLDAVVIFSSMPQVMRLNKLGSFSIAQLGQSKNAIAQFMRKRKENSGTGFQDAMLKLLRTLPQILKYLPVEKAQDTRNFMLSFQYWLGGSSENLENFLVMLAHKYSYPDLLEDKTVNYQDPVVYPDMGIWHPLSMEMFKDVPSCLRWFNSRIDISDSLKDLSAPCIGLILLLNHLVTGDDAHYVAIYSTGIRSYGSAGASCVCRRIRLF